MLKITEALNSDIEELMFFYDEMCAVLDKKDFLPNGNKGGFPSYKMIMKAIEEHNQFIGTEDGRIVAALILSSDCDKAYQFAHWQIDVPYDEVYVLHALRVLPQYSGHGYSKEIVEYAIKTAKKERKKQLDWMFLKKIK